MPINTHAHCMPPAMLEALESRAAEFGLSVIRHPPACSCAIHFDYGAKVRRFFPKLVEGLDERSASVDRQGIDRQVLSMWADLFGYGLPDAQSCAWHRFMSEHLSGLCLAHPKCFSMLALLPLNDPQAAAAELDHAVTQPSAVVSANVEGVNLGELPPGWASR